MWLKFVEENVAAITQKQLFLIIECTNHNDAISYRNNGYF